MEWDGIARSRQTRTMKRAIICSSHTISGVMPGSVPASRHSLRHRLEALEAAGYRGYWLHFRDYLEQRKAGFSDAATRSLFDATEMRYRGVEFLTDWFLGTTEARQMEHAAFDAARAIGANVISAGADFQGRGFSRQHMVEAFKALCARAEDHGLSIGLEFVPWSDVPDLAAALDFMEPANAGLVVDAWHVFRGSTSLDELEKVPREKILCIQVNDAGSRVGSLAEDTQRRLLCGEGEFDLPAFVRAVRNTGSDVPLSVEIISPELAAMPLEEGARRTFASCENLSRL